MRCESGQKDIKIDPATIVIDILALERADKVDEAIKLLEFGAKTHPGSVWYDFAKSRIRSEAGIAYLLAAEEYFHHVRKYLHLALENMLLAAEFFKQDDLERSNNIRELVPQMQEFYMSSKSEKQIMCELATEISQVQSDHVAVRFLAISKDYPHPSEWYQLSRVIHSGDPNDKSSAFARLLSIQCTLSNKKYSLKYVLCNFKGVSECFTDDKTMQDAIIIVSNEIMNAKNSGARRGKINIVERIFQIKAQLDAQPPAATTNPNPNRIFAVQKNKRARHRKNSARPSLQ